MGSNKLNTINWNSLSKKKKKILNLGPPKIRSFTGQTKSKDDPHSSTTTRFAAAAFRQVQVKDRRTTKKKDNSNSKVNFNNARLQDKNRGKSTIIIVDFYFLSLGKTCNWDLLNLVPMMCLTKFLSNKKVVKRSFFEYDHMPN